MLNTDERGDIMRFSTLHLMTAVGVALLMGCVSYTYSRADMSRHSQDVAECQQLDAEYYRSRPNIQFWSVSRMKECMEARGYTAHSER